MTPIENLKYDRRAERLVSMIQSEIVVLDGAMGTMIQQLALDETDFRGNQFADHPHRLTGCNDILAITRPDAIRSIHSAYLEAGANIIETDTFNANALSLADYGLSDENTVRSINMAAVRIAREAVSAYESAHPGDIRWVAGSVGPTGISLTMARELGNDTDWDTLSAAYTTQMEALIEAGVDLLLIETAFDSLNAKAALWSARRAMEHLERKVPVIVSITLTESGRTLSGQTPEAFIATISHAEPLAVGLNCGFGADTMLRYVEQLQPVPYPIIVYPNAGLPNEMGQYDETPEHMAATMRKMMAEGMVNIVGGCCGTTPAHIALLSKMASEYAPRIVPDKTEEMILAGLEPLYVERTNRFIQVGERCNVAGSRKFLRLIKEGNIDQAIDIAGTQVEAGADIVDINLDDAMLDSSAQMDAFVTRIGTDPRVAKVPLMIDSSDFATIMSGLKRVQGRPIVNSISLKEGEEAFLRHARDIREMGAAVIVMAFDENGQADTFERRTEVCRRAYRLLTEKAGFKGCDIVFDPNVLAVATGIESHNNYALDFIRSVKWIKENLPGAKVSGGVSNLSFALRGHNYVREAMHALFLEKCRANGMDMGIVNVASSVAPAAVEPELATAIDDVLLNTHPEATERLIEVATQLKEAADTGNTQSADNGAPLSPAQHIEQLLLKGSYDGMEQWLDASLNEGMTALQIVDGPLMAGMTRVGKLFGEGRMFLPQVVKSARTMKQAVNYLTPHIEAAKSGTGGTSAGKIILATVKGDVHDIGKNIVGVIMNCNGYSIHDLGVMVPAEDIIDTAIQEKADFIGVSGLITPSLEEMCRVARMMEEKDMTIPLLIGGATTSELHTAVKIAPCYSGPVIYTRDAAMLPEVARELMSERRNDFISANHHRQEQLRSANVGHKPLVSLEEARKKAVRPAFVPAVPSITGRHELKIKVADVKQLINWRAFLNAWKLDGSLAEAVNITTAAREQWIKSQPEDNREKARQAFDLLHDAVSRLDNMADCLLTARLAILPAKAEGDDIIISSGSDTIIIPTLRRQTADSDYRALADFIATDNDHIGVFAVTVGLDLQKAADSNDDYSSMLMHTLCDRLAEAATEYLHDKVRTEYWPHEGGIRPAVGYPSLPDQSLIFELDRIIDYTGMGVSVTENGAMSPSATTSGLMIANPAASYFLPGRIDDSQRSDYARRRGMTDDMLDRFLPR